MIRTTILLSFMLHSVALADPVYDDELHSCFITASNRIEENIIKLGSKNGDSKYKSIIETPGTFAYIQDLAEDSCLKLLNTKNKNIPETPDSVYDKNVDYLKIRIRYFFRECMMHGSPADKLTCENYAHAINVRY